MPPSALIVRNVITRIWRRLLEVPSRGLPSRAREDSFDVQHGTETAGVVWLTNLRSRNFASGIRYEPCSVQQCELAIERAGIDPGHFCFLDVGCGKGRPLIIASRYGFRRLIGIEYSARLCRVARRNLELCAIRNAEIIEADAAQSRYPEDNIFAFFFHPFQAEVLNVVLDALRSASKGHDLVVAYAGSGTESVARDWLQPVQKLPSLQLFRKAFD